jgi:hypothetical protein
MACSTNTHFDALRQSSRINEGVTRQVRHTSMPGSFVISLYPALLQLFLGEGRFLLYYYQNLQVALKAQKQKDQETD